MQEIWARPLGGEDSLEEGMATHSSILAWRIPWTEEPGVGRGGDLQSKVTKNWTWLKLLSVHTRTLGWEGVRAPTSQTHQWSSGSTDVMMWLHKIRVGLASCPQTAVLLLVAECLHWGQSLVLLTHPWLSGEEHVLASALPLLAINHSLTDSSIPPGRGVRTDQLHLHPPRKGCTTDTSRNPSKPWHTGPRKGLPSQLSGAQGAHPGWGAWESPGRCGAGSCPRCWNAFACVWDSSANQTLPSQKSTPLLS